MSPRTPLSPFSAIPWICLAILAGCSGSGKMSSQEDALQAGASGMGGLAGGGGLGGASGGNGEATGGETAGGGQDASQAPVDAAPPSPYATCIMPLGDSITQGDLGNMSYRYWLWKMLQEAGYKAGFVGSQKLRHMREGQSTVAYPDPAFDVDHEAYWGKTPAQILALMKSDMMMDKRIPGIVLLHAGTNEVWNAGVEEADVISQRAAAGVASLIDHLRTRNPRVTILLAKVIPLHPDNFPLRSAAAMKAINVSLAQLAEQKNTMVSPVIVVDQATGFAAEHFLPDNVHPNEAGEKRIASVWFKALEPLLAGLKSVACPL